MSNKVDRARDCFGTEIRVGDRVMASEENWINTYVVLATNVYKDGSNYIRIRCEQSCASNNELNIRATDFVILAHRVMLTVSTRVSRKELSMRQPLDKNGVVILMGDRVVYGKDGRKVFGVVTGVLFTYYCVEPTIKVRPDYFSRMEPDPYKQFNYTIFLLAKDVAVATSVLLVRRTKLGC